ncbi:ribulose-bisphosphate carboxylase large subunit family protein [Yoonia sediminilitoris]|uniref:Ribulose-bisphosphate carboxylase large chain n=1 Tax=Yoonia sediminilitoris TaxID=1286148 RepID=A0A2T6KQX0_9RHOB|nr:ribulose-bisphosphate carboxylase large subunit family protein [Yoonia sediminilitoris]PUB18958.1 ribulose-bisphosphate carboxylase large chain [Yoonia sediminilitoris]RCW99126.1 ribulose-bisphosphate carboxylase large chain [Yoonia sediminilitoris]
MTRLQATYDIESPVGVAQAAAVLAGEQSTGTFIRLAAETDSLRDRAAARVEAVTITGKSDHPALPCRLSADCYEQGTVTISWPVDTFGASLPNILATIAGNLFELAEVSAIRLVSLDVPDSIAAALPGPQFGITGSRRLMGVDTGPMIGTIIKPSVGLSADETAELAKNLALAGIDFIKDDELQGNGPACPLKDRAMAVMGALDAAAQKTGRKVMYAFNITDEITDMWRHLEMLEKLGATCAMVSLNSIGLAGLRAVRDQSPLPVHAHRNGWGLMSRSPHIGVAYPVMQKLWRMAGADHLHVNGLASKFTEPDSVVAEAAVSVQAPVSAGHAQTALPVFSSGQTAWQVGPSMALLGNDDFLFCAGGGIMSHPGGPAAGIASLRQAAEAQKLGLTPHDYARDHPELAAALDSFKGAVNRG